MSVLSRVLAGRYGRNGAERSPGPEVLRFPAVTAPVRGVPGDDHSDTQGRGARWVTYALVTCAAAGCTQGRVRGRVRRRWPRPSFRPGPPAASPSPANIPRREA